MSDPRRAPVPTLIGIGAKATVDTAKRLGLTWDLTPATVSYSVAGEPTLLVVVDGDSESIEAVNLLGVWVPTGARVMTLRVPPSGLFVVGNALTGTAMGRLTFDEIAIATAQQSLGAVAAAVAGVTHTFTVVNSARYMATGIFDFDETVLGTTVCIGELFVDGSVEPTGSQALFEVTSTNSRATVVQHWSGMLTAGEHTLDSRVRRSVAAGTQFAQALHTTLRVQVYE